MNMLLSKGTVEFIFSKGKIKGRKNEYAEPETLYLAGNLLSGEGFLELVEANIATNDNGLMAKVFINGYESNLGLAHCEINQGGFRVDGESWLEMCDHYDIYVEWCSK